ncbi:MAG: InlB B-repeat-containing protein [Paludibacteraceae bacterium]|nr:InlB B-repeat-containing protein [Paludibacteraceae bacterium]
MTLQPLNTSTGVLGGAISYTGTVGGVATTENNFNEITWNLTTAGGTYVLTVTSKTGYISQIDMTTETSAKFNVTYNGNGETGGSVPTDVTNYSANESVTVQAQGSMVKTNYTFGGWNTANNGTGTNYIAGSGTFSIKGATTLYAHWTQTINLAPGAKGTGSLGATVSWNGTAVRGFTAHTAAGYSLTGYYTDTSGGTKVLNADGSFAATNIDGYITDGKWSRTGAAATLYAQWSGSAIVTNTLGVGSSSKWKSTISTTAPLQITDLSALAAVGGLVIEDVNGTSASGRALTCKVEASGATTKTDGKYLQLSFSIAAGYKLRVTGLDVTVRSVGKAGKYHLELVGTTGSLIPDDEQVASGAVNTIFDDAYNVELTGDVTLKLWAYGADSDNKMSNYRLGSPIAIYGAVEESCTPPSFSGLDYSATEYTQGNPASAISVTRAENVDSYQWKYSTVNDRTSGTECGTGPSVTPSTASTGTLYYWCELTNGCTTVKTSTVAVTVSALASNPTVTWSDVKLNGAATTVNYGGGKYELRATVNETGWSGTLESSMITAPAGIYIHNIGTGTEADKKYIEFQFDVTTAFDREENETIGFHLSLPSISGTPNWNALTSDKQVEYEACDEGEGAAGQVAIPLTSTAQTSASNPQNYWEVAEAGWLAFNYGSAVSVLPAATAYRTSEVDFGYYVASTNKKKWMFQPYIAGVNKVRVAFRAAGNLSSGQASVSKFYYDTEYFSSPGSHENLIGDVSANQATYTSGENGYIEFTVPEMAANSYGAFELANSSIEIYGIVLYSENTGSGGTIETDPTWSGGLNKDGSSVVERAQGAANFTYTISTTTNTLGGITYSSSNPSVAEVNATTGEVRITATGESTQTAVITATLARSGCYQPATRTYTVSVTGNACTDPIGTIAAEDLGCSGTQMTFSGYAAGATIQWYKDGSPIADDGGDANVYTATAAGSYYAVAHLNCDRQSNSILVTAAEVDADRVVEKWYIKNGRLTPDIKLWTLDEGSHLVSVAWSPSNATGLNQEGDIYESDGAVYLTGRAPGSNDTGEDKSYTLTLTINNGCTGTDPTTLGDASKQITIIHQKNTDKHVLAFVVTGKQNGGFTESIPAAQTTSVDLYNEIAKNFDVLATNIYATDDEQKIKEYYSQFDIICITDYPNTKTKGSHSVSYSDAIGVMVDIRPVLTMEAWVSGLSNWNKKGISGDPKSPSTRQYTMLLQCKDHEIFAGTTLTEVGEGDEKMYRIHMVDETLHPYDTLDANYGSGTHESKKGYRYGSYPALQGFTFSQAMLDADLLPLGLIDDGAGNDLQVGLERQREMSARMMVLGINSTAMERLTDDGERIVINALKYLMKKNAEEIADCSTSFVGGAEGDADNWMNADNWTGNTIPDKTQKVRILAPCTVPAGEKVHVAGVLIAPNDGGTYNGGSTPTSGSLTIAAGGALVVDGKVEAVTAPAYNRPRATTPADLTILSSSEAQGALIFDNSEGETQATVVVHSSANKDEGTRNWQYLTSPLQETPVTEFFYGVGTYTYKHSEADGGWVRYNLGTTFHAFDAIGLTQEAAKDFVFYGPLAPTGEWNLSLTHAHSGNNLFGNSWTAPIDLKALVRNTDFDSNIDLDLAIYNTGADKKNGAGEFDQADNADNTPGTWHHIPLELATLEDAGWMGLTVIPAYQAFQLKATAAATLTIDYDKCVRGSESKNYTEPLRAPRRRSAGRADSDIEALRLAVSDANGVAYIYLLEGEQFTEGYDNGWELSYTANSKYGKLYAISPEQGDMMALARPSLEGTMVGFQPGESSEYTITFNETDGYYYLNDLKMEQSTLIQAGESYTFSVEEGESANRFLISSVPFNKPGIVTGVTNPNAEAPKAQKVIYNDKLYIIRGGMVFSADGQLVK